MTNLVVIVLSFTVILFWTNATSVHLNYEELDSDLNSEDLYESGDEDLGNYEKLLRAGDSKDNTKVNTSGYRKKNVAGQGLQSKHDIADLKKFYKLIGLHDRGAYDDADVHSEKDAIAVSAIGATANENTKYRKGTKTRGFHRVHHKDEYKKDKEFYEDDEKSGNTKRFGDNGIAFIDRAGNEYHKGHHHHDLQKGLYGTNGYLDKGSVNKQFKGYTDLAGFDGSFSNTK